MKRRTIAALALAGALGLSAPACTPDSGGDDFTLLLLLLALNNAQTPSCSAISDPLFGQQWHLENTGQLNGTSGEDARVRSAWNDGFCGTGINMSVVDDGLDISHADLRENVAAGASYDYRTGGTDPSGSSANHGTSVGGIMAARANSEGLRGAAPLAALRGYNLLQNSTSSNEADAMTRDAAALHISNNSWGPTDLTGQFADSNSVWRAGIETGLSSGRNGLGKLYFWAAGNGDSSSGFTGIDNSNYDGYANYHGVMSVCAIGQDGKRASYSEQGANLLVCGHSQGNDGVAIATTDNSGSLGYNNGSSSSNFSDANYTNTFNGTSAATPLVAGVAALVLQANPNLTWRDARLILAQSARKNDSTDSDWTTNGAGLNINHKYGFGAADAASAVTLARSWTNVGPQVTFPTSTSTVSSTITDGSATGVSNGIAVSGSGITNIEFVDVNVTFSHNYYRDLEITLTSPAGTVSTLMERGSSGICVSGSTILSNGNCPFNGTWRFGVTRVMNEGANGTWTLNIKDQGVRGTANGTFQSWSLKFYGR